jgi:Cu(I)/Ag(I) efflux system protein CusF
MTKLFVSMLLSAACTLAQADTPMSQGEITKLDKPTGRVTLKHGEIKNLDMPPMTMVFRVRDAKMLDSVAVGDRVRFVAEKVNGQYTLTALAKAP